jgi:hypothetical protein
VRPYLGLVPPCVVQCRCKVTYASLHTWRKEGSTGARRSTAIIASQGRRHIDSVVRNASCQLAISEIVRLGVACVGHLIILRSP